MAGKKTKGKSWKHGSQDPDRRLSARQQLFVQYYTGEAEGNATRAAELAGYKGGERACAVMGSNLLRSPNILKAIETATAEVRSKLIADRRERQEFLTKVMRGDDDVDEEVVMSVSVGGGMGSNIERVRKEVSARDRLKATELLGKLQGDYVTNVKVESADGLRAMLDQLKKLMSPGAFLELVQALAKVSTVEGHLQGVREHRRLSAQRSAALLGH
jgi:phage terminase small subunit